MTVTLPTDAALKALTPIAARAEALDATDGTKVNGTRSTYEVSVPVVLKNGTTTGVTATLTFDVWVATPTQASADAVKAAANAAIATLDISAGTGTATNPEDGKTVLLAALTAAGVADAKITALEPKAVGGTWSDTQVWVVTWTGTYEGIAIGGTVDCMLNA